MITFTCAHCPARLALVSTPTGSMTVDAETSPDGNLLVQAMTLVDVLSPKRAQAARAEGTTLHTNHRWTCPASRDPLALAGRP